MEGALYGIVDFVVTTGSFLAGVALLGLVVAGILFGYMREEERNGARLFWAEWPIPGTDETVAHPPEAEVRKAA